MEIAIKYVIYVSVNLVKLVLNILHGNIKMLLICHSYKGEGSWQRRTLIATQQENGTNKNNVRECSLESMFLICFRESLFANFSFNR